MQGSFHPVIIEIKAETPRQPEHRQSFNGSFFRRTVECGGGVEQTEGTLGKGVETAADFYWIAGVVQVPVIFY
jgi:hypothetical protein